MNGEINVFKYISLHRRYVIKGTRRSIIYWRNYNTLSAKSELTLWVLSDLTECYSSLQYIISLLHDGSDDFDKFERTRRVSSHLVAWIQILGVRNLNDIFLYYIHMIVLYIKLIMKPNGSVMAQGFMAKDWLYVFSFALEAHAFDVFLLNYTYIQNLVWYFLSIWISRLLI